MNISVDTYENPVEFDIFRKFIELSPNVSHVLFIGSAILDSPDLEKILRLPVKFSFAELERAERVLVSEQAWQIFCGDESVLREFAEIKKRLRTVLPALVKVEQTDADPRTETKFDWFDGVPCRLNNYEIKFDGSLVCCPQVNAFRLGMNAAIKSRHVRRARRMLQTGRIDRRCSRCCQCPAFAARIWFGKPDFA